jgi:hypothetical protein
MNGQQWAAAPGIRLPEAPLSGDARERKAARLQAVQNKPSSGLEPETPSLPWKCSTN